MKARIILLAVTLALLGTALFAGSAAATGGGNAQSYLPLLCVDRTVQVQFNQYGYFDGRTRDQMVSILFHGDPNGAVINGVWVQQLSPGKFADYVGPDPYASGAYVIHTVRFGLCFPPDPFRTTA